MKNLKIYRVQYASGIWCKTIGNNNKQIIYSDKELKENDFIVVEHINCGLFLGKVIEEDNELFESDEEIRSEIEYRYIQKIDLTNYFEAIEKSKRKEELKLKMISKFREIDEEKKYQYYAEIDENFRKIYEEYKSI